MQCRYPVTMTIDQGGITREIVRPCSQCTPCRINYSQEFMTRHYFESIEYGEMMAFLTLTYIEKYLPGPPGIYGMGSLRKEDIEKFMKRLRFNVWKRYKIRIRVHLVGEYGSKKRRPHYHLIIYGIEERLAELEAYRAWSVETDQDQTRNENIPDEIYKRLPGREFFGSIKSLPVEEGCSAYITKYILKGHTSEDNWNNSYPTDDREREFAFMARNPGIGSGGARRIARRLKAYKMYYREYPETNHWGEEGTPTDEIKYIQKWKDGKKAGTYRIGRYLRQKILEEMGVVPDRDKTEQRLHRERKTKAVEATVTKMVERMRKLKGVVTIKDLELWFAGEQQEKRLRSMESKESKHAGEL